MTPPRPEPKKKTAPPLEPPEALSRHLGARVKQLRTERAWSLEALAAAEEAKRFASAVLLQPIGRVGAMNPGYPPTFEAWAKSMLEEHPEATADVLDSLWNYMAGTICPIAAGLAVIGAIWNFVSRRPVLPIVGATVGLLTVSAVWKLITKMM